MPEKDTELTREELDEANGDALPDREVMSLLELNPGVLKVPHYVVPIDDPRPDDT